MMITNRSSTITALLLGLTLFYMCKPKPTTIKNPDLVFIDSLENEMRIATEKNPNEADLNLAMYMAQAYQNYDVKYPADTLSPKFLFKAGQVIENVFDDKKRASEIYYSIYRKYPKSTWAPLALFMTGNLFHTVNDTTQAIQMLQYFLAKYPDHNLKGDASAMIKSLGGEPDTSSRPVKELPMNPL
jgi:tetratricopeptide (TPR) repeat protein